MNLLKKNFFFCLFGSFTLLFCASCAQNIMDRDLSTESEFEKAYVPEPVTTLTSFAGYDLIVLSSGSEIFTWLPSKLREGSNMVVSYEVLFGKEDETFNNGDDQLLSIKKSDYQGVDTLLTLYHSTIDEIAEKAAIGDDEIGTIAWKVRSYCGLDMSLSSVTGYFKVLRPAKNATVAKLVLNSVRPYYIDIRHNIHYIKNVSNINN